MFGLCFLFIRTYTDRARRAGETDMVESVSEVVCVGLVMKENACISQCVSVCFMVWAVFLQGMRMPKRKRTDDVRRHQGVNGHAQYVSMVNLTCGM